MKYLSIYIILLGLTSFSQEKESFSSHEGREFYLAFMQNEVDFGSKKPKQIIYVASKFDNEVLVKDANGSKVWKLNANEVATISINEDLELTRSDHRYHDNIVYVKAQNPITLYGYSSLRFSSDIFTVVPMKNWGYEYFITTLGNDYYLNENDPKWNENNGDFDKKSRSGQFVVMAKEDDTFVDIYLSADSRNSAKGTNVRVKLDKGECYYVQADEADQRRRNDLTGTHITSDKPVGVITGHMRATSPIADYYQSKDHLVEMIFPTDSWGKTYLSVAFPNRIDSFYKIVAKETNTYVEVETDTGIQKFYLYDPGSFKEITINENAVWRSDKPIQIMQFMGRSPDNDNVVLFDPAVVVLNPVETYINNMFFRTLGNNEAGWNYNDRPEVDEQYSEHYIQLIMDEDAVGSISIDGFAPNQINQILNSPININGKNYFYGNIELTSGTHNIASSSGKFTGVHFGIGYADSYAHSLGTGFSTASEEDEKIPEISFIETDECGIFEFRISDEGEDQLGIYEIRIEDDNIKYTKEFEGNDFIQDFIGYVIDIRKDAFIKLFVNDFAGNSNTFEYEYVGIEYNLEGFNLGEETSNIKNKLVYGDIIVQDQYITNLSEKKLEIVDYYYPDFIKINNFDRVIDELSEINISATLNTLELNRNVSDSIVFNFACGIREVFKFNIETLSPDSYADGYEFGKVYLGEEKEGFIYIFNKEKPELIIEDIIYEDGDIFEINNIEFPIRLSYNEELRIPCKYSPKQRQEDILEINIKVHAYVDKLRVDLDKEVYLTGEGVAPLFNSVEYDFGRVQAGQKILKTVEFENTGNIYGDLSTISLDSDNKSYSKITNSRIENLFIDIVNDTKHYVDLIFEPSLENNYQINATLDTYWKDHPEIRLETRGSAYMQNDCFENPVKVKKNSIEQLEIYQNLSNERVFIENIILSSATFTDQNGSMVINPGDADYPFDIYNVTDYFGEYAPGMGIDNINIYFEPKIAGKYKLALNIDFYFTETDNAGISQTIVSYVCAEALDKDMIDLSLNLNTKPVYACQTENFTFDLYNSSEVSLDIVKVDILQNFELDTLGKLPVTLDPKQSVTFEGKYFFQNGDQAYLDVEVEAFQGDNDTTIFRSDTDIIEVLTEELSIDNQIFSSEIGKDSILTFSGGFPYETEINSDFYIEFKYDPGLLFLNSQEFELRIINDEGSKEIFPITMERVPGEIKLNMIDLELDLSKGLRWEIDLNFLALINVGRTTKIDVFMKSEKCFSELIGSFDFNIADICIHPYRPIVSGSDNIQFNYLSAENKLSVEFESILDEYVELNIVNLLGQRIKNFKKKFVLKGNHLLYYDLEDLPSGKYLFSFDTGLIDKGEIIIISK